MNDTMTAKGWVPLQALSAKADPNYEPPIQRESYRPDADADTESEQEPQEQDGRGVAAPRAPARDEPAERVTRATPQRRQRAPMIRQPEDVL